MAIKQNILKHTRCMQHERHFHSNLGAYYSVSFLVLTWFFFNFSCHYYFFFLLAIFILFNKIHSGTLPDNGASKPS